MHLQQVSGHLLGGVVQPSTTHLPFKTHSLLHKNLQDEDESSTSGLDKISHNLETIIWNMWQPHLNVDLLFHA